MQCHLLYICPRSRNIHPDTCYLKTLRCLRLNTSTLFQQHPEPSAPLHLNQTHSVHEAMDTQAPTTSREGEDLELELNRLDDIKWEDLELAWSMLDDSDREELARAWNIGDSETALYGPNTRIQTPASTLSLGSAEDTTPVHDVEVLDGSVTPHSALPDDDHPEYGHGPEALNDSLRYNTTQAPHFFETYWPRELIDPHFRGDWITPLLDEQERRIRSYLDTTQPQGSSMYNEDTAQEDWEKELLPLDFEGFDEREGYVGG